jgi:hypothetical protein
MKRAPGPPDSIGATDAVAGGDADDGLVGSIMLTLRSEMDGSLHHISLKAAQVHSSTLADLIGTLGDRAAEEVVPVPSTPGAILNFLTWAASKPTAFDTSALEPDTYVASLILADWLAASGYLRALLLALEGNVQGAHLARVQACAKQVPNMAALLMMFHLPTLSCEADARALLDVLAEATEADGSALSWPQLQMCDGEYLRNRPSASLGLTRWGQIERKRRRMAGVVCRNSKLPIDEKRERSHGLLGTRMHDSIGPLQKEAFLAANDELWAVFCHGTDKDQEPPFDLAASQAAFDHGACVDLFHDSSNVERQRRTLANPLAQKRKITEQKILYELLHELDAQCDAMPPDPAIDISGLATVMSQVHPDMKIGPGGMALIHVFTRPLLEAILRKAVDLAPAMSDLQPEPTEIKPEGEPAAAGSEPAESVIRLLDKATEQCLQGELARHAKEEAQTFSRGLKRVQGGGSHGLVLSKEAVAAALAEWLDRRQVAEDDAPPPPALRSESAVLYFTAVLEYLTAEVMELAGNVYRDSGGRPLADLIVHRQTDLVAKTSFLTAETRTLRERIDAGGSAETAVRDAVRAVHTAYGADYDFHDCWDLDGKLIAEHDQCELPKDYLAVSDPHRVIGRITAIGQTPIPPI